MRTEAVICDELHEVIDELQEVALCLLGGLEDLRKRLTEIQEFRKQQEMFIRHEKEPVPNEPQGSRASTHRSRETL